MSWLFAIIWIGIVLVAWKTGKMNDMFFTFLLLSSGLETIDTWIVTPIATRIEGVSQCESYNMKLDTITKTNAGFVYGCKY